MILTQRKIFILILVLFLISLGINLSRFVPESKNYGNYIQALELYGNNQFQESYFYFGKVAKFSKIKSAAIYRQALCAEKLEDTKTEIKKYNEVIRLYPNSVLALRAKYLKAQKEFYLKNYSKAKKEFTNISRTYPKTDYALASKYFLGSIECFKLPDIKSKTAKERAQKQAVLYFKDYLKQAPRGKFATSCIEKWIALGTKLNNEDNLLIAMVYQLNGHYKEADKYLNNTSIYISWPYFVQSAYNSKDYSKVKYYTELGLKGEGKDDIIINNFVDEKTHNNDIYKAIDLYLKVSDSPKNAISYLLSIAKTKQGHDYLLYKNCTNLSVDTQAACFNTLYYKYPDGQFAAEALAAVFYDKVKQKKYFMARKIGKAHLAKFKGVKSSSKIMFWLGKVSEFTKNYDEARSYYRSLMKQYPDDYYAYCAFLSLNRFRYYDFQSITPKEVVFPYKNPSSELITELVQVKDYGLINQLYKSDAFIESWLAYQQGNYSTSTRVARDAMDNLPTKPDRFDLRWRLVYPIHYYDEILQYSKKWDNDSALILSIIREESYFNPEAQSRAGARGLMQLMPSTAREVARNIGLSLPNDNFLLQPDININLGNLYYSNLKKIHSGKEILAVLAYNGGPGSVLRWKSNLDYHDIDDFIEQVPYSETQNYLKKVYRSYWNYLRIYDGIRF